MRRRRPAEPGPGFAAADWAVRYALPLLGAALYGVLRLAYVFFYLQVRATPEEVGYGYVQVLAGQLIGAVELVVVTTVLFLPVALSGYGVLAGLRRLRGRPAPRRFRPTLRRLAVRSAVAAAGTVLAGLPALAWLEGAEARAGFTVRNVYLAHTVRLPVLAVQAVPTTVAWTAPPGPVDLTARRCLMYLGEADGTATFYDVHSQESLRIPTSAVVISLQQVEAVPDDC